MRHRSQPWPPLDAPVPCRVYWIYGPHPIFGFRALLWVGECVDTANRGPRDRFAEHLERQPWGDTVLTRDYDQAIADGTLVVSATVYPTKRKALEAEQAAIIAGRPLYNDVHNRLNPDQIPKWTQAEQRKERDQNRNVPRHLTWAVKYGPERAPWWWQPVVVWKRLRRRTRRRITAVTAAATALTAVAVVTAAQTPLTFPTTWSAAAGAATVGWLWWRRPPRRRGRRPNALFTLNRYARWLITIAVIAQVLLDLASP